MTKWISVVLGLVALVAGTVLATLAVPGSRQPGTDRPATTRVAAEHPATDLRLASASLRATTSCEALLAQYVERALAQVGPYGWDPGPIVMFDALGATRSETAAGAPRATTLPTTTASSSSESGTNVQEAGVDEPDVVKAAGDLVLRVRGDVLTVHDVSGDEPRELSSLTLDGMGDGELLVTGDRVVVLGPADGPSDGAHAQAYDAAPRTRVVVLDVSDPGAPQVVGSTVYGAELTAARLHGDPAGDTAGDTGGVVRLVLRSHRPALDFVQPGSGRGERAALELNRQVVGDSSLADWLPTLDGEPLVDCADVAVPADDDAALGTTTVVGLRPADPDPLADAVTTAVAADAATSYFSPDRFYLATAPAWGWWGGPVVDCSDRCGPLTTGRPTLGGTDDGTTDLYAFALGGAATTFVAGGEVEGAIRDRWAMDFSDGTLRVAVGPTMWTEDASSVIVLREDGSALTEVGRVDGLGVGEEITAVRWFDDLAIVVTFRRVDPLYAVDLTDPTAPRLVGELEIPGYSEYLHPLGGNRLLGIGQDASADGMVRGAQAALFDVTDLTSPARLDTVAYPPFSTAGAGTDPRQLTWLPDQRVALAVVSDGWAGRTGWVSVLRLGGDRIRNEMVQVEVGDEVAEVRLVPLADGRVVLVTGDGISFFDL